MKNNNSRSLLNKNNSGSVLSAKVDSIKNQQLDESVESESQLLSIEQLNQNIRALIESQFSYVWVKGEISNFKPHSSGHFYFSLKDAKSQIKAVMFRGYNSKLNFRPTDGIEVIVRGKVTVYEPRGDYQITVESMEPVGAGALQKAFEELKLKLRNEGLFDREKKRELPKLPQHILIVTSPTGAAIRDMINVLTRRYRAVKITVIPTVVQGEAASPSICNALDMAYKIKDGEVIILGRGGGSIEDMWCFNTEEVARKIAASPIPIVSAIGHEIDFTIADFVADVRASTPSAAAELVVKNAQELNDKVLSLRRLLSQVVIRFIKNEKQKLKTLEKSLIDPKQTLNNLMQRRDDLEDRLGLAVQNYLNKNKMKVELLKQSLVSPKEIFNKLSAQLKFLNTKISNQVNKTIERKKSQLTQNMVLIDSLSPLKVVERGYSIVKKENILIKSVQQINIKDQLTITFATGSAQVEVTKKES